MITVPLVRSMPPKKALELMLTGRRVGAEEAERMGFVNRVVPAAQFDAAVGDLATTLAAKSPTAMSLGRDSFYAVWDMAAAEALAVLHPLLTWHRAPTTPRREWRPSGRSDLPVWPGALAVR